MLLGLGSFAFAQLFFFSRLFAASAGWVQLEICYYVLVRDVWVSQYSLDDDNVLSYHWSARVHPLVNIPPEPECTTPELVTVS